MPEETTRIQLQMQLSERKDAIERRIDEIEDEITGAPAAIVDAIRRHPLVGIAGAVLTGVTIGFLVTARRRRAKLPAIHRQLVEQYIDAVVDEVRRKVRRGKNPEEAVQDALRDRAPVIIYAPDTSEPDSQSSRGFIRDSLDIMLKSALGFAVKSAFDFFTARINLEELQQMTRLEREERRTSDFENAARETREDLRRAASETADVGPTSTHS